MIELIDRELLGVKLLGIKGDNGSWDGPSKEFQPLADEMLRHVKKRELVVTAGGCQGVYARLWHDYARFERVVTAEPDPDNFSVLERNAGFDWCTRYRAALGEAAGRANLYRNDHNNRGMHSMTRVGQGNPLEVDVMTIDSLDLPALDALQLDVEGFELSALMGAAATIGKYHPVIAVETCTDSVRNFLAAHGYHETRRAGADVVFA